MLNGDSQREIAESSPCGGLNSPNGPRQRLVQVIPTWYFTQIYGNRAWLALHLI